MTTRRHPGPRAPGQPRRGVAATRGAARAGAARAPLRPVAAAVDDGVMRPCALLLLAALACQPLASAVPGRSAAPAVTDDRALLGAWRSNEALTLQQVAGAQLAEPQR